MQGKAALFRPPLCACRYLSSLSYKEQDLPELTGAVLIASGAPSGNKGMHMCARLDPPWLLISASHCVR